MTTLVFDIPKALWLTSNRHITNRQYRAAVVRNLHALAALVAQQARLAPILTPAEAHWEVRYPKGVRTDKGEASNAQPTTKALLDGIVAARLLEDDGPKWIARETYERGANLDVPSLHRITLTLTGVQP